MILAGIEGTPAASLAAMAGIPSFNTTQMSFFEINDEPAETQAILSKIEIRELGTQNYQRALAKANLHPTARIILTEIAATYSVKGDYYQSVQKLADTVALCKRTVQRWIKKLSELGFIKVVCRIGTTNKVFPQFFSKLAEYLKPKEIKATPSNRSFLIINGNEYSKNTIKEYIENKSAHYARGEGYAKALWKWAHDGTLDLSDLQQYISNPANFIDEKQTAQLIQERVERDKLIEAEEEQHIRRALSDNRPLEVLEKLARDAARRFRIGPLGKTGHSDLQAIKQAKRLQGEGGIA